MLSKKNNTSNILQNKIISNKNFPIHGTLCIPVLSVEVGGSAEVILLHGILFTLGLEAAISTCTDRHGN